MNTDSLNLTRGQHLKLRRKLGILTQAPPPPGYVHAYDGAPAVDKPFSIANFTGQKHLPPYTIYFDYFDDRMQAVLKEVTG